MSAPLIRKAGLLLVALLLVSACLQIVLATQGDKDWLLYAARRWQAGAGLYSDIVEVNPPLIIWLYALAVKLAAPVPALRDYAVLGALGLCFALASAWLCMRLMAYHPAFAGNIRMQRAFGFLLVVLFVFFTRSAAFFDRDDIIFTGTFAYMLRFMPSLAGASLPLPLKIATGLMAALGFCIKPHAVILFAAIQALCAWRRHSLAILLSLENAIVVSAALIYILCVWRVTPEYFQLILPMAFATYGAFASAGSGLLYLPMAFVSAGLALADFRPRYGRTPYRADAYYFMGIALAWLLYALAGNGWQYTYHPLLSMLLFLCGWMWLDYAWLKQRYETESLPVKPFLFGMRGCCLSIALQACYAALTWTGEIGTVHEARKYCAGYAPCRDSYPYAQYLKAHGKTSFGTLSMDYPKWLGVVHMTGAQWRTRFNNLWMLPRLMQEDDAALAHDRWVLESAADALAEDLDKNKPAIMFVDIGPQFFTPLHPGDLLGFLRQVPAFEKAWAHYHLEETVDYCSPPLAKYGCNYAIYSYRP